MRRGCLVGLVVLVAVTLPAVSRAQTSESLGYAFASGGYGSLSDDEGGLGTGAAIGAGAAWWLSETTAIEAAVSRVRHERTGSLAWRGTPVMVTARVLRFWGASASRVRVFAGGGGGYLRYAGTRTDTVFDAPNVGHTVERDWHVQGAALEGGGGVHINLTRSFFVRPEAWLTVARPVRTGIAPEPPYSIPRVLLSAGLAF